MVRLASVNVNGLEKHQDKVIDFVKSNNIDVLCLQEIHLMDRECIDQIEKAVKGVLFYNEAQWSGTGIILRNFFTNLRIEYLNIDNIVLINRITHRGYIRTLKLILFLYMQILTQNINQISMTILENI